MTPELRLYHDDRAAWLALVAPRMPAVIDTHTDESLAPAWRAMGRDFQRAAWDQLNIEQRTRLRRVCAS